MDGQTKRQNSIIEVYLKAFVKWEQNKLPIAKFAHDNTKNASTSHTPFKINCSYNLRVCFEEDINPHAKSSFADELARELRERMEVSCQNLTHEQEL